MDKLPHSQTCVASGRIYFTWGLTITVNAHRRSDIVAISIYLTYIGQWRSRTPLEGVYSIVLYISLSQWWASDDNDQWWQWWKGIKQQQYTAILTCRRYHRYMRNYSSQVDCEIIYICNIPCMSIFITCTKIRGTTQQTSTCMHIIIIYICGHILIYMKKLHIYMHTVCCMHTTSCKSFDFFQNN